MQNRTDKVGYIRSSADKMCNRTLKVRVLCLIASLLLLFVVCFLINNIICGTQITGVVICSLSWSKILGHLIPQMDKQDLDIDKHYVVIEIYWSF